MKHIIGHIFLIFVLISYSNLISCQILATNNSTAKILHSEKIIPGANNTTEYFSSLVNKNIGLVINQTSVIGQTHLLDSLINFGIKVKSIFTPEHGFRGDADAGEKVNSEIDQKTGIPIISLYGKHKKPTSEDFKGIDIIVFDIQDVGVRFYTYISTLHLVMEACAENNVKLIVLDRPNPNGFYVAGPVLDPSFSSFVGMHPVPIVYGLTIGEYAKMINGEKWLNNDVHCNLDVISCKNYDHTMTYDLPIKPSPNLPNLKSILLYPSLCLFEGTVVSIGRGTQKQFQIIGHPNASNKYSYTYTPTPMYGAKYPKLQDQKCKGEDLSLMTIDELMTNPSLKIEKLIEWYKDLNMQSEFWLKTHFIDKLAGTDQLRLQIEHGVSAQKLRDSWQEDLETYKKTRKKYLLYKDF